MYGTSKKLSNIRAVFKRLGMRMNWQASQSTEPYRQHDDFPHCKSSRPGKAWNVPSVLVPSLSIEIRDYSKQHRTSNISVQQTIPMPKYFRSVPTKEKLYIIEKPVEEANEVSDDHGVVGPSQRADEQQSQTNETIVYKWKVKRRCDGSRYVVKRPARSQILKKRAAQLIRERTGISTDDDAMSELKLGHFHTREERKKHLEEERRRKIRNQQKLIESKISPADQMIVQLSQRKMQRRKEKMLLDGFVTTQEVLSQRNPDTTAKHGILSVTTV
ncbi:unnamed protein product [Nippostrongylus brasiliensis]|uniref:Slo-interacting protein 1 (inferred by orthology to a D. melanogaster protein) n=1 Tax=Nippostrongylus brasiliensis TaxID=27835 RepID=A0A0N4YNH8_NIPBR|nr:unnamed protein product [Nippostrongylus brasiliensis]